MAHFCFVLVGPDWTQTAFSDIAKSTKHCRALGTEGAGSQLDADPQLGLLGPRSGLHMRDRRQSNIASPLRVVLRRLQLNDLTAPQKPYSDNTLDMRCRRVPSLNGNELKKCACVMSVRRLWTCTHH